MKSNQLTVGLLTPYSGGNLGDGAIQEAVIRNLKRRIPNLLIYGITLHPEDTEIRHNILSFPLCGYYNEHYSLFSSKNNIESSGSPDQKTNLWVWLKLKTKNSPAVYRLLKPLYRKIYLAFKEIAHVVAAYKLSKRLDLVAVSGGGQLDEYWGGPWGHPYVLFKWGLLAKMTRTKFIMISVGKSTVDSSLSRFFIKWALKLSAYRSYRDEVSKKLLDNYSFTRNDPVFPDLVFSLPIDQFLKQKDTENSPGVVGVSPIAYCDPRVWPKQDAFIYGRYISTLASFVSWLLLKEYRVLFFSTDGPDRETINDIISILKNEQFANLQKRIMCPATSTVEDLLSCVSKVNFVVASRLHAVKLSHMLNKSVLAISYERKVDTYMGDMGQSEYCVGIETFDLEPLIAKFTRLLGERVNISADVKKRVEAYGKALQDQYDKVCKGFKGSL